MSEGQDQGMDALSPVMSYDPGSDHLERVISEGEPKYEGKGKGRSESFSNLPNTVPSTPSTAPSTRPTSEIPDASSPSTAPSTRPTSEIPSTGQAESAAMATQCDPGSSDDQAESASATGQGDSAASSAQDVQASETEPTFLDPFNSEPPAIEPTGPPNSLTNIPTAKDKPLNKKSTRQMSITKESGSEAAGPKATDPVTPRTPSNPPQVDESAKGASESQANQPQKLDAAEGQDLGSNEPRRVELGGTDEIAETQRSNVDDSEIATTTTPLAPLNSPHHRHDITPKSILKKTVGTAAEARQAEEGGIPWGQFGPDGVSEPKDPSAGTKLFRETIAKYKAARNSKKVQEDVVGRLNTETESGAGTPRLNMELHAISGGDSDGKSEDRARKCCLPRCTLLCFSGSEGDDADG